MWYALLAKIESEKPSREKSCGGFLFAGGGGPLPYKPKRPCSHPDCPKLTDGRFCEEHAKQEAQRYERYDRDPTVRKRYNRTWRRIHDRYITAHPLCERCKMDDRITPAEEVHHIKPLSRGGTNDPSNLMALCTSCHSQITAREGGRWKRGSG